MLKVRSSSVIKFYHLCLECKTKAEKAGKVKIKDLCPKCNKKYWQIVKGTEKKYSKKKGYVRMTNVSAKEKVKNHTLKLKEMLLKERNARLGRVEELKQQSTAIDKELQEYISHVNKIDEEVKKIDNMLGVKEGKQ